MVYDLWDLQPAESSRHSKIIYFSTNLYCFPPYGHYGVRLGSQSVLPMIYNRSKAHLVLFIGSVPCRSRIT